MKRKLSMLLAETVSVEKIMVLMSCPCEVPKPVRRTTARQPPSGAIAVDEDQRMKARRWDRATHQRVSPWCQYQ